MSAQNNDPAFPGVEGIHGYGNQVPVVGPNGEHLWVTHNPGITKREYFAAAALTGILACDLGDSICPPERMDDLEVWRSEQRAISARYAFQLADAMVAASKEAM